MTKLYSYSKGLNIVAICCFLLPFFYTGCEKKDGKAADADSVVVKMDTINNTSIQIDATIIDSSQVSSIDTITNKLKDENAESNANGNKDDISLSISKKIPLLAPILVSESKTYSGIAIAVNLIAYFPLFSIIISFLFLLICLIAKYIEPNTRIVILLLEIISFTALAICRPGIWIELLWGYWLALGIIFSLIICDSLILRSGYRARNIQR